MKTRAVNITIPTALLKEVDERAKQDFTTRSDFIRQALLDRVRRVPKLDEWGDPEGMYKTIIDFREIDPDGVPASKVLKAIRKLNSQG